MKNIYIFLFIIGIIILCKCISFKKREGFTRNPRRRVKFWDGPQEYLHRFRRRAPYLRRVFWFNDRRYDPHYSTHYGIHYGTHYSTRYDPHYGIHYSTRYDPHYSTHYDPQSDAESDADYYYNYDYLYSLWPRIKTFWSVPLQCKRGCTPNGCATPGTGPEDCVWSSDCNGC